METKREERPLRSEGLKQDELENIAKCKNMSELQNIDPNAKSDDHFRRTILHWSAKYAWVEGVEYLMSCEQKADITIKDTDGGSKVSRLIEQFVLNPFEMKRLI